jgi:hypothetical protein
MTLPSLLDDSSALRGGLDVASLLHGCGHGIVTTCGASVKRSSDAVHLGTITLFIYHNNLTRAAA